ncbi:hypothetical protein HDV02_002199 [Globomyces sp. JEL0801]|nr:hypothetical protein HDV02_002199 [Globomyces sp. JEL0801]
MEKLCARYYINRLRTVEVSDLADNAKELDAITLKYSRVSTINNNTYYTSRLPQLF